MLILTERYGKNHVSTGCKTILQGGQRPLDFAGVPVGIFYVFIPSDMFEGRYTYDEIVLIPWSEIDNVLVDDAMGFFILVQDIMVHREIVGQNITEFQDLLTIVLFNELPDDRYLYRALTHPCYIVGMVKVG